MTEVIKDCVFLEREVETAKIELALRTDFNLMDAFRMFDPRGHNDFTAQEFMESLRIHL